MNRESEPGKHNQKQPGYRSYLLRLWCTEQAAPGWWRASVEDPHTGERIGFGNLEELFAFLMEQVEPNREPRA